MSIIVKIQYFTEDELKCPCCGLCNYDSFFLKKLDVFREMIKSRLQVTSGCRCAPHNLMVSGAVNSCHIGEGKTSSAVDVFPMDLTLPETFVKACESNFFNEVIYYKEKRFIHLGFDEKKLRPYFEVK
ncbi:MAG: D-Ala-D-Ala carboxypeptidase family metallohydrolase [Patescibacteria group bacterium]|nr:D-Ala-D-Ala carboxypeptidase family metallohydrolase [Patescibacteria group bacterium]